MNCIAATRPQRALRGCKFKDLVEEGSAACSKLRTRDIRKLTETCFLLARQRVSAWRLLDYLRGTLRFALNLDAEATAVRDLMVRFSNIPMSLADACLVRLAEISGLPVCTLDSDFAIYRVGRRKRVALIMPPHP
jgi:predicted nucleic acid-binding protein